MGPFSVCRYIRISGRDLGSVASREGTSVRLGSFFVTVPSRLKMDLGWRVPDRSSNSAPDGSDRAQVAPMSRLPGGPNGLGGDVSVYTTLSRKGGLIAREARVLLVTRDQSRYMLKVTDDSELRRLPVV